MLILKCRSMNIIRNLKERVICWVSASPEMCKFLFLRLVSPEAHAMSLIIHLLQEDKALINSNNRGKRKI